MPIHTVQKGECLSKIAHAYGLPSWRTIYDDPKNAEFRKTRPNPNLIQPGDKVHVRPKEPRDEPAGTETRHRYKAKAATLPLKLKVGRPYQDSLIDCPYELRVGPVTFTGRIPSSGILEHRIPVGASEAELIVHPFKGSDEHFQWVLLISQLDPIDTVRGVQQRLNNLWFYAGHEDGIEGPTTRTAVRAFQRRHKLKVDGLVGPETRGELEEVYGC